MLEFSQLRCFVAVAETLHFGRAAVRLNMTQPPVSRQIQALEHELGVSLFERTSRTVQLTLAGRGFLAEARHMLQMAEGAMVSARRVSRGEAGAITLGFTAGSSYAFLPRLVSLTLAAMPGVELVLREMNTAAQMEALTAGRLDAGLVRLPVDRRGVELACVTREPMVLAVPEGDADHYGAHPALSDLGHARFIMYSPMDGRYFFDLTTSLFRLAEIAPSYVLHVSHVHTALALVSAGMGVALVPETASSLIVRGVSLRALRPSPPSLAELHLAWRRGQDNPAFGVFRDVVLPRLLID